MSDVFTVELPWCASYPRRLNLLGHARSAMESARLAPTSMCVVVPVYVPETQQAQGDEIVRAQGVR